MSYLETKSQSNKSAGNLLKTKKYYTPSIHCFYYSCLQLVKHTLIHKEGVNHEEVNNNTEGMSSHNYLIQKVSQRLWLNNRPKEANDLKNDFGILKRLRIKADYEDIEITDLQSQKAKELNEKTLKTLKEEF